MKSATFLLSLLCSLNTPAQSGDKAGEEQKPPKLRVQIPESPALSPEKALETFRLQPGFQIQLVASEPLIESPVEIEFDPDGRLYVLEMRGFMRGLEGQGEDQPLGRVSLLEDTDADGRMDKGTVFVDSLVMPRAIAVTRGALLIAEPPHLWLFRDENGDGKADKKEEVANDYGNQSNPEHTANGLLWGRDNWFYSANHTVRYRNIRGYWEKETTQFRGQWGITQDDEGRLFFNSNSDQLRGDLIPGEYLLRNPNFKASYGVNFQVAKDQSTFPARVNPGVNRGYQKGTLRSDGTLARFTGACGPAIYRGDLFPPRFYEAAFLCEPTANLVRCNFLSERDGFITGTNAFPNSEFLASTDERFRPVNALGGPDGALYIVDMYRGVIQHRIYLTTYLRNQALSRGLEAPVNLGRIYRVVPEGTKTPSFPRLSQVDSIELVKQLNSRNGWTRDTAQQLLVERNDFQSFEPLNALAAKGEFPASIHALSILNALGELTPESAIAAIGSGHAKVRAAAVRVAEPYLRAEEKSELAAKVVALQNDPSFAPRLQLLLSLGYASSPEAQSTMIDLLDRNSENALIRSAAISGLKGREFPFLAQLLARSAWSDRTGGRHDTVRDLSACIAQSREASTIEQLLELASNAQPWQQSAMLDGLNSLVPAARGKSISAPKPIRFASEPPSLARLKKSRSLSQKLSRLNTLLVWPGKPGYVEVQVQPLSTDEQQWFDAGKAQYALICGACHQPTGAGLEGLAPPLADSEWVTGSADRLTRIVLNGVRGKLSVKGKTWEMEMPALNILSDQDIASLLTYIRREWDHSASPISPDFVARVRAATAQRDSAWTEPELLRLK